MKLPRLKKDDLVEVIWVDVVSDPTWLHEEQAAKSLPSLCKSAGYYLNHDKCLRISGSLNRDLGERDVLVMPMGLVLKVTKLG